MPLRPRKCESRVTSGDRTAPMSNRSSEAHLDQRHAAEDERPQDAFAELGVGDQQRAKLVGRNDDRLHLVHARASIALGLPESVRGRP